MARLEYIRFTPHRLEVNGDTCAWVPIEGRQPIIGLPQLVWKNGAPWVEANLWALERASHSGVLARKKLTTNSDEPTHSSRVLQRGALVRTVQSNFNALLGYANWLESQAVSWRDFPSRKADRCLVRYRGALIKARDEGLLAPSTVSQRMSTVIQFYEWLHGNCFFSPEVELWSDLPATIRISDKFGFDRTISFKTTDLAIPNRSAPGEPLEDGLYPVSSQDRDKILQFARDNCSEELFLMLSLGFFTGMRIGSITGLRIKTLEQAIPDPASPLLFRLAIGPGATPPVPTKYGVTGHVWISKIHLQELKKYCYSVRRMKREAKATRENSDLIFLTRFGNRYTLPNFEKSNAINVEIFNLRNAGILSGIYALNRFHFHQSRCTFATELASLACSHGNSIIAVALVKQMLLHKNESTSMKYIRFIEKTPIMMAAANEFTKDFLGIFKSI